MKEKTKGFLTGVLLSALVIAMAGSAMAAYQKTATLHYQGIKITLDGQTITPKTESGAVVEPFTIDGTTYLPVRAVADSLGLDVSWDGTTKTVKLASKDSAGISVDDFMEITRFHVMTAEVGPTEESPYANRINAVFLDDMSFYLLWSMPGQPDQFAVEGQFYVEDGYLNILYPGSLAGESIRDIYKVTQAGSGFALEHVQGENILFPDQKTAVAYKVDNTLTQYDVRKMVDGLI